MGDWKISIPEIQEDLLGFDFIMIMKYFSTLEMSWAF